MGNSVEECKTKHGSWQVYNCWESNAFGFFDHTGDGCRVLHREEPQDVSQHRAQCYPSMVGGSGRCVHAWGGSQLAVRASPVEMYRVSQASPDITKMGHEPIVGTISDQLTKASGGSCVNDDP